MHCRNYLRPAWATLLVLVTTAVLLALVAADPRTIKVLDLIYTTENSTTKQVSALNAGFRAAFQQDDLDGIDVQFIRKADDDDGKDVSATITAALTAHPDIFTAVGPFADSRLIAAVRSGVLQANNLVLFSPYTGSQVSRFWTPNVFHTRTDPNSELLALLLYILNELQVLRVGFMYLTGVSFGDDELLMTRSTLSVRPEMRVSVYAQPYHSELNQTAFDAFVDDDLQAVIVYGMPGTHVRSFMRAVFADPRTKSTVFLASSGVTDVMTTTDQEAAAAQDIVPADHQIVTSATNLQPDDTSYSHIRQFRAEMEAYLASGSDTDLNESAITDPNYGELLVAGWVGGKVLAEALGNVNWNKDRASFMAGLFEQNRFIVGGDFVLGDYGGDCSELAEAQGAVCRCNQGGRTAFLKRHMSNFTQCTFNDIHYSYDLSICQSTGRALSDSLNLAFMNVEDDAERLASVATAEDMVQSMRLWGGLAFWLNTQHATTTSADLTPAMQRVLANQRVSYITGPVSNDPSLSMLVKIHPLFARPQVNAATDANTVILIPTLEQQVFVLGTMLGDPSARNGGTGLPISSKAVRFVVKDIVADERAVLFSAYDKAVTMHSLSADGKETLARGIGVDTALAAKGTTFVVGADRDDAERMAQFLQDNTGACVVLCYEDFSLYYGALTAAFGRRPASVGARLLTTTNFPHWADTSDAAHQASLFLKNFHHDIQKTEHYTPSGLENYLVQALAIALMQFESNSSRLINTLYVAEQWTVNGLSLGPYQRTCNANWSHCEVTRNYGASSMSVVSMSRALDPTVGVTYAATQPDMIYTVPAKHNKLSTGALVGIIVGCVAFAILLVVLIALLMCCCSDSVRANRSAPKDVTEPVTLMFTDIESSTALWAAVPQIMPDAVATHHKLIRQLIKKYGCYEVKTIGDSFMIASKSPCDAVQLARDIQLKLLKHDWGTTEIDSSYRSFEMRRRDEMDDYQPPTAMLNPDVYKELWNGLRVRIGIHTGLADIRCDERTKGYDYYGETSNMAARTEAIGNGGQVLLTESAYWALSHAERAELNCMSLGPQGLRGVPYAVEMYQLNAVPARQHVALRTEIEAILPNDGLDDGTDTHSGLGGTEALLSSAGTMTGPAAAIALVLTNCYSPYQANVRAKELQPLLQKWNIPVPPRNRRVSDDDYCQGLINRLAIKMSTVAQMRQRIRGVGGAGDLLAAATLGGGSTGRRATNSTVPRSGSSCEPSLSAAAVNNLPSRHCSIAVSPQPMVASRGSSAGDHNPLLPGHHRGRYSNPPQALARPISQPTDDEVVAFDVPTGAVVGKKLSPDCSSSSVEDFEPYNQSTSTHRPHRPPSIPPPAETKEAVARRKSPSQATEAAAARHDTPQTAAETSAPRRHTPPPADDDDDVVPMGEAFNAAVRRKSDSVCVVDVEDDEVTSIRIAMPDYVRAKFARES